MSKSESNTPLSSTTDDLISCATLKAFKLNENALLPTRATEDSACFDVCGFFEYGQKLKSFNSWNKEVQTPVKLIGNKPTIQLHPEHRILIPTGLIFDIPEHHVLKMYIRSSVALKQGLSLSNGTGIIDADYVEQSYVMLTNMSESLVNIISGERLAQVELQPVYKTALEEITERPETKTDREGGFGSTGK